MLPFLDKKRMAASLATKVTAKGEQKPDESNNSENRMAGAKLMLEAISENDATKLLKAFDMIDIDEVEESNE